MIKKYISMQATYCFRIVLIKIVCQPLAMEQNWIVIVSSF